MAQNCEALAGAILLDWGRRGGWFLHVRYERTPTDKRQRRNRTPYGQGTGQEPEPDRNRTGTGHTTDKEPDTTDILRTRADMKECISEATSTNLWRI